MVDGIGNYGSNSIRRKKTKKEEAAEQTSGLAEEDVQDISNRILHSQIQGHIQQGSPKSKAASSKILDYLDYLLGEEDKKEDKK